MGERGSLYLTLLCLRQTDSCITMDSNDSHFDVFINCEGQSHEELINHKSETDRGPGRSWRNNTQGRSLALQLRNTGTTTKT